MGCSPGKLLKSKRDFRDVYFVKQKLGMGAFGVVYKVVHRETDRVLAVKMIDRLTSSPKAVDAEMSIMSKLQHPHVNSVVELFTDNMCIYVVTELYSGGDLLDGYERHTKLKGRIPQDVLQRVFRQVGLALVYCHSVDCVHRDIKGDNFLLDRMDLADPECHLALTDFGCATSLAKGGFLSDQTGTEQYWCPEILRKKYSHGVDVWAVGVTIFGIVEGKFPFQSPQQTLAQPPREMKRASPQVQELLKVLFEKKMQQRPSAADMLNLPFFRETAPPPAQAEGAGGAPAAPGAEAAANLRDEVSPELVQWRQNLVKVLDADHQAHHKKKNDTVATFVLADIVSEGQLAGEKKHYEWWSKNQCVEKNVDGHSSSSNCVKVHADEAACQEEIDDHWLQEALKKYNINVDLFGKGDAKTMADFQKECLRGEATLAQVQGRLERVVDVIVLRVRDSSGGKLLIEKTQRYPDGRIRTWNRLPGMKRRPHESPAVCGERVLEMMLKIGKDEVQWVGGWEMIQETQESPSYPGVLSLYRKHIAECVICTGLNDSRRKAVGLSGGEFETNVEGEGTSVWTWVSEKKAKGLGATIHGSTNILDLVAPAPAPMVAGDCGVEELQQRLVKCGIDTSLFGTGEAKSIESFSAEVSKGLCSLKEQSGSLRRIVTIVAVRIFDPTTERTLVMTAEELHDGRKLPKSQLPGLLKRPHENTFDAVRRYVTTELQIPDNFISFNEDIELNEEERESPSYPGIKTVYRKQILSAIVGTQCHQAGGGRESKQSGKSGGKFSDVVALQ